MKATKVMSKLQVPGIRLQNRCRKAAGCELIRFLGWVRETCKPQARASQGSKLKPIPRFAGAESACACSGYQAKPMSQGSSRTRRSLRDTAPDSGMSCRKGRDSQPRTEAVHRIAVG